MAECEVCKGKKDLSKGKCDDGSEHIVCKRCNKLLTAFAEARKNGKDLSALLGAFAPVDASSGSETNEGQQVPEGE